MKICKKCQKVPNILDNDLFEWQLRELVSEVCKNCKDTCREKRC